MDKRKDSVIACKKVSKKVADSNPVISAKKVIKNNTLKQTNDV